MKVRTESGTEYEFDGPKVRRVGGAGMRRDEEWLTYSFANGYPAVGHPMILFLEPLGYGNVTIRTTSDVVSIDE